MNWSQSSTPRTQADSRLIFGLSFSTLACVAYVLCDLYKLPLFTFFPAVKEVTLGFAKFSLDQGPAMYWYGWIGTSVLVGGSIALVLARLSWQMSASKTLAYLCTLVPWLLLPVLVNSLNFYWNHA